MDDRVCSERSMAKTSKTKGFENLEDLRPDPVAGPAVEALKSANGARGLLTTSQDVIGAAEVVSLADERVSIRTRLLQRCARDVGERAFARAEASHEDAAYPAEDVAALHECGLAAAVLPVKRGGVELSGLALSETLQSIGSGSLPLGRLFEGHVNALELVLRYGKPDQVDLIAEDVRRGNLFGVWK